MHKKNLIIKQNNTNIDYCWLNYIIIKYKLITIDLLLQV